MRAPWLRAPGRFELAEVPAPGRGVEPGQALVRVLAGGICGSDAPYFRSALDVDGVAPAPPGAPLHEIAGEVIACPGGELAPGQRVVGWAKRFDGLADYVITEAAGLHPYRDGADPARVILAQPLACVLHAAARIGPVAGRDCAVLGLGSIGLLFCHVLAGLGAASVTGVDQVDREAPAGRLGASEFAWASSGVFAADAGAAAGRRGFDVVVEAIGHQAGTLGHAMAVAADGGLVFYFGVPDDVIHPIDMDLLMRRNLTLMAGETRDRRLMLARAEEHLDRSPELADILITHRFHLDQAQRAFELATGQAGPRLKIVLDYGAPA